MNVLEYIINNTTNIKILEILHIKKENYQIKKENLELKKEINALNKRIKYLEYRPYNDTIRSSDR